MPSTKPRIKEHYFRYEPGIFGSQKKDGTAIVDFKDGASLELQLSTGSLHNTEQLSCLLRRESEQAHADWSYTIQEGSFLSATLQPSDILPYLESVQIYSHIRSTIPLSGRIWVKKNFGFYNVVVLHSPTLSENIRDNELKIIGREK